jgi:HlyD family secretion protein
MTTRKKVFIGVGAVVVAAGLAYANLAFKKTGGLAVTVEPVKQRDLEAVVSASGKIKAKRQVNISADRMGRVVRLAVNEGDRVKAGQFLLQIDPRMLKTAVHRGQANLDAQRQRLQSANVAIEGARVSLKQAQDALKRQQDLWKDKLPTREALEQAENSVSLRESDLKRLVSEAAAAEQQIRGNAADLASAQHDLSLVTVESPIDGIIVRRNIEEGETAVMGTMNQPGTVLLTVADMSVIEAEIEVDETDIPTVHIGQQTKVTIDALPDKVFAGKVTEVGNSPIQATATSGAARRPTSRWSSRSTARFRRCGRDHLHGRHHDRHAQGRPVRHDSGNDGPRARLRRVREDRQGAEDGQAAPGERGAQRLG